jgi:hypothetical protein
MDLSSTQPPSEVGACFQNAQSVAPLRVTLTELGHQEPATPLRTDNSTAFGILNETHWSPGKDNIGYYHTKHMRPLILHQATSLNVLRGCIFPQPQPRTRTDTHTGQRAQRATQIRAGLSHACATTYQNRIMDIL